MNPISKLMHENNFDFTTAMKILETSLSYLKEQRFENDK